ncbi:SDR family NAD(P)-dependent oxidoreductase [Zhongshania aquimaris]|uniref:SDR family oxidoreductase n=1 Tax=Zhongshania aquimaris TaxID=2857107 RepID=A0ABS6VV45_9GAMM|nr:SDR family oxidoreductase [Zhongshania aquimaris]MBW2942208.1 SDR family oxidoreductase [Zhongshania aquimaris]
MTSSIHNSLDFNFTGADILVTGGTSGIGLSIARRFQAAGANVTVTGTRESKLDYTESLDGMHYRQLVLENLDDVTAYGESLTKLDILVNNAGRTCGLDEFEKELLINLTAVQKLTTACFNAISKSQLEGGGSIINLASMMSYFGSPYFPGYGAAKAGIVQMTKTYGAMWGRNNVRVNSVAAGSIATRMTESYVNDQAVYDLVVNKTPLYRWGSPDDISSAVLFLSSSSASFITGQTLVVDGGYSIID